MDIPFNIDTKISSEDTAKPSNNAIGSDNSSSKLQFKEAYDSALKSDFATLKGNSLPVANSEIAGISHPSHIALSKPVESQMMRLGDFNIEISGTSASLDDTVAFAQEIGLGRDFVETILLQSSASGPADAIALSDRLSSPAASNIEAPAASNIEAFGEMEDAADAIATLISSQLRSQISSNKEISSNKDSGLSLDTAGFGAVIPPAEIRALIDNYIELQSDTGDNLNVEIALKKSDIAQSISAVVGAPDFFAPGFLDRTAGASVQAHQKLKRIVLETLNMSPALDDVRQSLLARAGQKNSSEIASQPAAMIPELRQQASQLTAESAKDFLRGVSQDPNAGRHFLSARSPEQAVTRNTLDVISGRGVTGSISEGDAMRGSKAREAELNVGTGNSVKAYELAAGSKPPLDTLKATVKAEASFLSADNPASSAVTKKGELSGSKPNIDQVTPQVLRGSDLGISSALSGGDLKRSQEDLVGDTLKVGLKNSIMDENSDPQKILRGGDLNSYIAADNNRIEPSLVRNSDERSELKSANSYLIKNPVASRVDFEARGDSVKDESEFRQVDETQYRVSTKGPRVSGEFDQRLNRSIGANEASSTKLGTSLNAEEIAVQRFSASSGASETESPKRDRSDLEGQFASIETNAKRRQSRVSQDPVPRSPESSLEEDRVGTLRGLDLGSRVELVAPNVAGPPRNSSSQLSKVAGAKTTDSPRVEPTQDFLMKRELSKLGIIEPRVAPQSIDGGTTSTSPGLPAAASGSGFGIEPTISSAAPTISSGLNLSERGAPLDSSVLAKASSDQASQNLSTRETVGENLSRLIGQRMLANVEAGNYRINFNLFPKDMGMVDITMELRDGRLDAQINASNTITRELLGDTLPRLRDALNLSGFSESNIELGSDQHRRSGNNGNSETTGNERDSDGKDLKDGEDGSKNIIDEDLHLDPDTVDLWA